VCSETRGTPPWVLYPRLRDDMGRTEDQGWQWLSLSAGFRTRATSSTLHVHHPTLVTTTSQLCSFHRGREGLQGKVASGRGPKWLQGEPALKSWEPAVLGVSPALTFLQQEFGQGSLSVTPGPQCHDSGSSESVSLDSQCGGTEERPETDQSALAQCVRS
jgi:hypothetical protein